MGHDRQRKGDSKPPRAARPLPGGRPKRLGRYEILGKIAKGGMATIYVAHSASPEDRDAVAAVKVVRHELSDDENVDRMFLDESALLQRLVHPNIVRTFESGVEGDQRFIAMELLLGHTLLDVWKACIARKTSLSPGLIAWIGGRIADALDFAHELKDERGQPLNVIHRDVNPANVFLTYDGELKLFDFGLAKSVGRRARSKAGIVKGKLPYLAPEQIMQSPLDRRCDLFALGTTLWELATLRPLFMRDSDVDTVKAVRSGPIPDPRKITPSLPADLAKIILRALERNRVHRYATAAELGAELDAFARAHGGTSAPARIRTMLTTFFPEDHARQTGWKRASLRPDAARRSVQPPSIPPKR